MNLSKSKVIFRNCPLEKKTPLSGLLHIQASESFDNYLGFPILHKRPCHRDYQFINDNINNKLAGWKTKYLNWRVDLLLLNPPLTTFLPMPFSTLLLLVKFSPALTEPRKTSSEVSLWRREKSVLLTRKPLL